MGYNIKTTALAAVAALALPLSAGAATLNVGDSDTNAFVLSSGQTASFSYEPTAKLRVSIVTTSGTDTASAANLMKVLFGVNGATQHFTTYTIPDSTASAEGQIATFTTSSPFTIDFSAFDISSKVSLGYSFNTFAVSTVPVPAAGLLLGGVVAAGGAFARRRKAKSEA